MNVRIVNQSRFGIHKYATEHSAGVDLCANIEEPVTIGTLERKLIGTGIFIELPEGYEAQIRPRSGLAVKHGISIVNSPGTVDADYRGEIKVILINLSKEDYTIEPGERICQMIIGRYEKVDFEVVQEIEATARGEGGFGHSGKN